MAVSAPAQPGGDKAMGDRFLVDTGAVFFVLPFSSSSPPTGPGITTADASPIPCWGWVERRLRIGGICLSWTFLRAKVAFPILGADFLAAFDLVVDLRRRCLIRRKGGHIQLVSPVGGSYFRKCGILPAAVLVAGQDSKAVDSSTPSLEAVDSFTPSLVAVDSSSPSSLAVVGSSSPSMAVRKPLAASVTQGTCALIANLERDFSAVFNTAKDLPPVIHMVQHHIKTESRPVGAKYRRLDAAKLKAAQAEFRELKWQGVIRWSSSNWASPLHLVKKSDGTWRPYRDFRQLNMQSKRDRYTCPNIGDLTAKLAGCHVFSKLDLRKGYHQVPVQPEDVHKTAVVTPFGMFEFLRMPFGLRNAGQTFQRMMDEILAGLDYCFVYLDDILVASRLVEEHKIHLEEVLTQLQQHGLVLNAEKCAWFQPAVSYLGHEVSSSGIRPLADRVSAISKFPLPATVPQLQTYLGMVNFYRHFLRGAA